MYMYILCPFIDEVLKEEIVKKDLMKWVGIFQVGIFRGEFDGWEFFPERIFLEPFR